MLCVHGTTILHTFLKNEKKESSCWNCSESDSLVYVWRVDRLAKDFGLDEDDFNWLTTIETPSKDQLWDSEAVSEAIRNATESAILQAATKGVDTRIILYVLDVPEDLLAEDWSCANMESAGTFERQLFCQSWLKSVLEISYNGYLSPFLLAGCFENPYLNKNAIAPGILQICEKLQKTREHSAAVDTCWELAMEEDLIQKDVTAHLAEYAVSIEVSSKNSKLK